MPNKPVVAVTNPLQFAYLRQQRPLNVIASRHGLMADYASELGFTDEVQLYEVANTPQALVEADATPGAAYISWKPVPVAKPVLGNAYNTTHQLEQKTLIRQLLPAELFPAFVTIPTEQVAAMEFNHLAQLLDDNNLVVQIDDSTGGKGTFLVDNAVQLEALLPQLLAAAQPLAVSRRIKGVSRGLQCMIYDGRVLGLPWWHKDLVGLAEVCKLDDPAATHYCGAVLENIPAEFQTTVQRLIERVGKFLIESGYYGIFGLDIVVDEATGQIYLIEINPRFTAVSHLYATAMRAVGYETDFLTAHVQGLLDGPDKATADQLTVARPLPAEFYYFKLQNLSNSPVRLKDDCRLGVYSSEGRYLRFGWGIDALRQASEMVVIPEFARSLQRSSGDRVFSVIGRGDPLQTGRLSSEMTVRLEQLRQQFLVAAE